MESTALGLPLLIDSGTGTEFSPISTFVVSKGMDTEGNIVYALAFSEGMDIIDALALVQYALLDVNERVKRLVTSGSQETE